MNGRRSRETSGILSKMGREIRAEANITEAVMMAIVANTTDTRMAIATVINWRVCPE